MTTAKELLEQATPLPWQQATELEIWRSSDDGPVHEVADVRFPAGLEEAEVLANAALIVYAVNRLPDYEAAVDALARVVLYADAATDCPYNEHHVDCDHRPALREEVTRARAALARLRGAS